MHTYASPATPPHSNLGSCKISCLDADAFNFTGASEVDTVVLDGNSLSALPEKLLWNMSSLRHFSASANMGLATIPERFFLGQSQLVSIDLRMCTGLAAKPLPDGLFRGLVNLARFDLMESNVQNLPNLDDLTVR